MNASRIAAVCIAIAGVIFAAYIEFGSPRAADVERSFGWFAYEAGPWVVLGILALLSPFARAMLAVGIVMLAVELFAYARVFVAPDGFQNAIIYYYKPFYDMAVIAAGVLAGFLLSRTRSRPR
ncbi:MAG: hypothetical protein ABI777_12330 [Betaproteobacteria bacterium]